MRVLIADDDRYAADLIAELIHLSLPCEIQVAYDGTQALQMAMETAPAAMVLDLYMPGFNGIEVAERLHRELGQQRPYLIALTGAHEATRHLSRIDSLFDRVFSKPLDGEQVISALQELVRAERPEAVPYDVAELFTQAVRYVAPLAVSRGLAYSFDYRGPALIITGGPVDAHRAIHRLLLGLLDMLEGGFAMFSAQAQTDVGGGATLVLEAAGTGQPRSAAEVNAVLHRLLLIEAEGSPVEGRGSRLAQGTCPNTGAAVSFWSHPAEGTLLRATLTYTQAAVRESLPMIRSGTTIWLVKSSETHGECLLRRLQRHGCRVRMFDTVEELLQLGAAPGEAATGKEREQLPTVVIVIDRADLSLQQAGALHASMPSDTRCILAVTAGSERLAAPEAVPNFELKVLPFSPRDLEELGAAPDLPATVAAATPHGDAGVGQRRPRVLLVDDNEINRIVGRGLVEALGYEVRTANDGLDAIDHCRRTPPEILLMDLDMPVLHGLAATLRLRELQRIGEVAPFAIIAATADASEASRRACTRAGMDAFMAKPLSLEVLSAQLRRFSAAMPPHAGRA